MKATLVAACTLAALAGCLGETGPGDPAPVDPDVTGPDAGDADADAGTPIGAPDAGAIGAGGACTTPPASAMTGAARVHHQGSGGFDEISVAVTWTLVSTVDCVDAYQPSGTASFDGYWGLCAPFIVEPTSWPIAASDGELRVDRSTSPPTYRVTGETRWNGTIRCNDEVSEIMLGDVWAESWGSFEGGLIDASLQLDGTVATREWRFVRAE